MVGALTKSTIAVMPSLETLAADEPRRALVRDLKTIQSAFYNYPDRLVNKTGSASETDYSKYPQFTNTIRALAYIGCFSDGEVILWATSIDWANQSHRLIVPESLNEFSYYSYRYNVIAEDLQGEETLDLKGIEAIASKNQVNVDIARITGQIATLSALNWDNLATYESEQGDIFTVI